VRRTSFAAKPAANELLFSSSFPSGAARTRSVTAKHL
jgi:hypothetical protein